MRIHVYACSYVPCEIEPNLYDNVLREVTWC
jgi:hypothetical protein